MSKQRQSLRESSSRRTLLCLLPIRVLWLFSLDRLLQTRSSSLEPAILLYQSVRRLLRSIYCSTYRLETLNPSIRSLDDKFVMRKIRYPLMTVLGLVCLLIPDLHALYSCVIFILPSSLGFPFMSDVDNDTLSARQLPVASKEETRLRFSLLDSSSKIPWTVHLMLNMALEFRVISLKKRLLKETEDTTTVALFSTKYLEMK